MLRKRRVKLLSIFVADNDLKLTLLFFSDKIGLESLFVGGCILRG